MQEFKNIIGNEQIKTVLTRMVDKRIIPNSILFAGPDGIGKSLFAEAFAKSIICANDPTGSHQKKIEAGSHPDIRIYRPEGKIGMHSIDSMRQFCEEVSLSPYEAERKIFIIHDADRMLTYSANALLKTFEEPFQKSIIILVSSNSGSLLPTILSRCRTIRFHALTDNEVADLIQQKWQKSAEEAKAIARLSSGSMSHAVRRLDGGQDILRDQILALLSQGKMGTYKQLMSAAEAISEHIEKAKQSIEETLRQSAAERHPSGITSVQQQSIDKEIEGTVAMHLANEAHAAFDIIIGWYRDMHLLQVGGRHELLLHPDALTHTQQALVRGDIVPLETVQAAIAQARLSLERSTSLSSCLENLFLKLNFI